MKDVQNMAVYEKDQIPDRFFYKKGRFVPPLTLVAEQGWFIAEVGIYDAILVFNGMFYTVLTRFVLFRVKRNFPFGIMARGLIKAGSMGGMDMTMS